MTFPSEQDFALFLFQLFTLLSVALTLESFLRKLGQAAVVGGGVFNPKMSRGLSVKPLKNRRLPWSPLTMLTA